MKRIRISLCILLTVLLCALCVTPSFAAGTLRVSVSSASGSVGQKVTLTVKVTENPGIAGMALGLSYDTQKIKLVSAAAGSFAGTTLPDPSSNNQRIVVTSTSNVTTTGTVASLTFEILSAATGSVSVAVRNFGALDENMLSVGFSASAGKITVTTATVSSKPVASSKPAASSKPVISSKPAVSSKPAASPVTSAASSAGASEQGSSAQSQAASSLVSSQTLTSQPQASDLAVNAEVDPNRARKAPITLIIVMGVLALAFVGGAVYFGFFYHKKVDDGSEE
ncbi:MAG: hypothetical protein IJC55_02205 [Clostridia bacterium]|nr:hypothetical protein [Clostridia bacterium]